jgi:hypothetical protein
MARNYDTTDLVFTDDFMVDPSGDILASDQLIKEESIPSTAVAIYQRALSEIPLTLQPIARHILDVCSSYFGSWKFNPKAAANLVKFTGEKNSAELSEAIETAIREGLRANDLVSQEDLTINIIPVSHKIIFVKLDLKVEPTIRNNMTRFITMNALYNASLGNMTVVKP